MRTARNRGHRAARVAGWGLLALAGAGGLASLAARGDDFDRAIARINRKTKARQISVGALRSRLAAGEPVVVLDIREPRETGVSTLPGARTLPPSAVAGATVEVPAGALIVTYCTVGYRSGLAAVELEKKLGRPVFNLDGGIIAWFNAGAEVVDPQGQPTDRIDPYDESWARHVTRAAPPPPIP